jgi:hypothetical protein
LALILDNLKNLENEIGFPVFGVVIFTGFFPGVLAYIIAIFIVPEKR